MSAPKRGVARFVLFLLNLAYGVTLLGLLLTTILLIVAAFMQPQIDVDASLLSVGSRMEVPVRFTLGEDENVVTAPALGIDRAEIRRASGLLRFPARRGVFFFANAFIIVGMMLLGLWVLQNLRAVLRSVADNRPFERANAKRIREIAFAVLGFEAARSMIVFFESYYAKTYFTAPGLSFEAWPEINGAAIFGGLIILVIAEVFRAGTRLADEQSLTI